MIVPGTQVPVVLNPGSRRGASAWPEVRRLLTEAGVEPRLHAVGGRRTLGVALDEALAGSPPVLVVGGGDGTVGLAADRVAGTATVLGVLPLGTANDFARTLELPGDLVAATRTLLDGRVVDVDLGRVAGAAYLNVASLGLSVAVTQRLTPGLKRRLGPAAYPVATLLAYGRHAGFAARLEFPEGDHEPLELEDLLQVAVGNGVHYGGGNTVSPTASVDDHLLDVYAIVRGRLRDHVSIARFLRTGDFVEHELVHHVTTRAVRVVTDEPMPVNLDGELAATTPATFTVERNAVHVLVPVHSRAARLDGPAGEHRRPG